VNRDCASKGHHAPARCHCELQRAAGRQSQLLEFFGRSFLLERIEGVPFVRRVIGSSERDEDAVTAARGAREQITNLKERNQDETFRRDGKS